MITSAIIGFILWNRYKLKQQLKEVQIRNKIASDLHDDVGATLSSIRMYSNIVSNQVKETSPQSTELLEKISSNSKEMIENMSDIVWMIKPGNDALESIENRMLNFANELCTPAGVNFEFTKDEATQNIKMPMEQRRDLYLIFKEAVNNAIKYSGCTAINARMSMHGNRFQMIISDDGNGFDLDATKKGNGLDNIQKRTAAHNGKFMIRSSPGERHRIDHFLYKLTLQNLKPQTSTSTSNFKPQTSNFKPQTILPQLWYCARFPLFQFCSNKKLNHEKSLFTHLYQRSHCCSTSRTNKYFSRNRSSRHRNHYSECVFITGN
jgi:hypothetical protein